MPKKLGTCPKALEARERKAEKKKEEKQRQEQKAEDEYWKDDDKLTNRKQQRKEEKDSKKQEHFDRKKEKEKLYEEELASCKSAKSLGNKDYPEKVTQAQIFTVRQNLSAQLAALSKKSEKCDAEIILSNPNRLQVDGLEARTVEEAIAILNVGDENSRISERHPERRFKAAYLTFEERIMPQLKEENPGMRHSQLKQLAYKLFQTSPDNPKNQQYTDYNAK